MKDEAVVEAELQFNCAASGRRRWRGLRGSVGRIFGQDGLRAVGKRAVRIVMHLDEQAIRAHRDRRARERQHFVAPSGAVVGSTTIGRWLRAAPLE